MDAGISLLTIEEAAQVLRVHRSTISWLLKAGEIPYICVRSRKLIRFADLRAFIDRQIGVGGGSGLLSEAK